jgi:3-deoxy-D-arabino-heptulosonate 7-phosphate (DAHP) synthase
MVSGALLHKEGQNGQAYPHADHAEAQGREMLHAELHHRPVQAPDDGEQDEKNELFGRERGALQLVRRLCRRGTTGGAPRRQVMPPLMG